ncbi:amidohydrolase family protein [Caulobacter segnis]
MGFAWEMQLFASGGATPLETIRAATMGSAEAIGRTHDIGSLEAGKFADLLDLRRRPAGRHRQC